MSVSTPSDRETNKHVDQFLRTAMPLEAVSSAAPGPTVTSAESIVEGDDLPDRGGLT